MLSTGRLLQAGAVLSSGEVAGAASMGQLYAHCSCISNSGINSSVKSFARLELVQAIQDPKL